MNEDDRPKRSWSEIDRMRDGSASREERRPRGREAEARARNATGEYLKTIDRTLFAAGGSGGAAGHEHAKAVLDARGSSEFDACCRAYLEEVGAPVEAILISAFLDARDKSIRVEALRSLAAQLDTGLEPDRALRNQVRALAEDFDDTLAEAAEDALAKLPR